MLDVGLTGGIGSGKSTVAAELRRRGALVVDADVVAREVMEPGTPTLAAVGQRFGDRVIRPDGALDRPALAALVFPDPAALADLDAITTPAIRARVAELRATAPREAVTVFDMPLLVERRLWPAEHLTIVVDATVDTRIARLVSERGLAPEDVRHRMAAQASDEERRAAADVWIDNDGSVSSTRETVVRLWEGRLAPYNENLLAGRVASEPGEVVPSDPTWPAQAHRLAVKLSYALRDNAVRIDHVGPTSMAGGPAADVLDLQVSLAPAVDVRAPELADTLRRRGFIRDPHGSDEALWRAVDPGRPAHLHLRSAGSGDNSHTAG